MSMVSDGKFQPHRVEPWRRSCLSNALATDCTSAHEPKPCLRELSARHFRGHKVLDAGEELLRLLGAGEGRFPEGPVQLHAGAGEPTVGFYDNLGFAGLALLAQSRTSFPSCVAWRPGYEALLACLGAGHAPDEARKERQQGPGVTGCSFADQVLLPALRSTGRCVDQELWPDSTAEDRAS